MQDKSARLIACIPRLRRYARALTGERGAADDLVRETMERGWCKLSAWQPGSDMRAWLFGILHQVQAEQARRFQGGGVMPAQAPVVPAASVGDNGALRDMDAALAMLPAEQRAIVLLVALEEMTYEEVAATLGIAPGAVLSRLSRARECLRKLMSGQRVAPPLKVVK